MEPEVQVVPIEDPQEKLEDERKRRDQFYETLDQGDILIFRVINDTLVDNFKLLVLYKESFLPKLDDLSLVMFLPRSELERIGENLQSNDLIRAAVSSVSINERKIFVTCDTDILGDDSESEYLGKISEEDLTFYLGEVDIENSYVICSLDHLVDLRDRFRERLNGNSMDPSHS